MKKYIIASLMILIPFITWANDRCTNPSAYTIDKRCYVTDEEKAQKPYNTTVALIDHVYNDPMCTGTIIQIQDMLVVYTAAHCIVVGENKIGKIKIRLQDGREFIASHNNSGNYVTPKTEEDSIKNYPEDWAIYNIPTQDDSIPYTSLTNNNYANANTQYKATVVGYGSLKIMSDQDISNFKKAYIEYLKQNNQTLDDDTGYEYGGIYRYNATVIKFLSSQAQNSYDTFANTKLKKSECAYTGKGDGLACQIWGGNSGGPIFDNNNRIMGIVTLGAPYIGGQYHAEMGGNISLLQ